MTCVTLHLVGYTWKYYFVYCKCMLVCYWPMRMVDLDTQYTHTNDWQILTLDRVSLQHTALQPSNDTPHRTEIFWLLLILKNRGTLILEISRTHLKIPDTRRVTWSKFHNQEPKILAAHVQNLVSWVTWHTGFMYLRHDHLIILIYCITSTVS
jgi:hypothetical protein